MTAVCPLLITPPSSGDIRIAAETLGWPRVVFNARTIEGDRAWREALALVAHDPAGRLSLWEALGASDHHDVKRRAALPPAPPLTVQAPTVRPLTGSLARHRTTTPTTTEASILDSAIRVAARCGVTFSRGQVEVYWTHAADLGRDAIHDRAIGGLTYVHEEPVRIFLARDLPTDVLYAICVHELHHAYDALAFPDMGAAEHECRAEAFTAAVMGTLAAVERGAFLPLPRWNMPW